VTKSCQKIKSCYRINSNYLKRMEPPKGLEPSTLALRMRINTAGRYLSHGYGKMSKANAQAGLWEARGFLSDMCEGVENKRRRRCFRYFSFLELRKRSEVERPGYLVVAECRESVSSEGAVELFFAIRKDIAHCRV
jgi:hypothetical protein